MRKILLIIALSFATSAMAQTRGDIARQQGQFTRERIHEQNRLDRGARDARIEAYAPVPRRNCGYRVPSYDTGKETIVGVIGRWWHC